MAFHSVFVTGASGYLGRALVPKLVARGHQVRVLVRPGKESRVRRGPEVVTGDALDAASYRDRVAGADTFVHLVGTPRPKPSKAALFESVDFASVVEAVAAAKHAGVRHLVYVSVAQPAPVMKAYIDARARAEAEIRASGLDATILRPWYVLGPGHLWPYLLMPVYVFAGLLPGSRATAQRLGLVRLRHMNAALVQAVEEPATGVRVVEVPEIRRIHRARPV